MSQLLKHYFINRETGAYATDTRFGLMMPNIKGLEVVHQLFDVNDIPYCLSTCPEYFEYSVTISSDQFTEYQNNPNITIISSEERVVEVPILDPETPEQTTTQTVYDVVYQELYVLTEVDGLEIITQEQWDNEITLFDNRQLEKRISVIRTHRDEALKETDWIVIKSTETGVGISTEFKDWRQNLRDFPGIALTSFPSELPQPPEGINVREEIYSSYLTNVTNIPMVNDPLPIVDDPLNPPI